MLVVSVFECVTLGFHLGFGVDLRTAAEQLVLFSVGKIHVWTELGDFRFKM